MFEAQVNDWEKMKRTWTPWLRLRCQVPFEAIFQEFERVRHLLVPHRHDYSQGWLSLTLYGMRRDWTEAIEQYPGYQHLRDHTAPYDWTDVAEKCPATVAFLKSLPYQRFFRVRFMYLEPGGEIRLHQDVNEPNLGPLNIAIRHPSNCHFDMYHPDTKEFLGRVPFESGHAFFVNIGTLHTVRNESPEGRLHMIVHGVHSNEFYQDPIRHLERS